MKGRPVLRTSALPPPRHFRSAVVRRIKAKNHSTRPIVLGEFPSVGNQTGGGWASFVPAGESKEVRLRVPEGGEPYEAMREWFFRREAAKSKRPKMLDLNRTALLWNYGGGPLMSKEKCGTLHLSGTRTVSWGPYIQEAIKVWEDSGCQGVYPPNLLAYVEPDQHLPFLPWHAHPDNARDNRWLSVAVDLGRPIEDQFEQIQKRCKEIREYALLLVGIKPQRPGRHEVRRDILAFTLHYSAGLTIPQVAKELFPHESPLSRERKTKDIIRRVRRAYNSQLLRSQRHTPRPTK